MSREPGEGIPDAVRSTSAGPDEPDEKAQSHGSAGDPGVQDGAPEDGPGATRSIELEAEVDAPVEDVWAAISTGEGLSRWFPPYAEVTPGVGGSVLLSWGSDMVWRAPIVVWEPGVRIGLGVEPTSGEGEASHGGGAEGAETPPAAPPVVAVELAIRARGGKAIVRVVHSGFSADAAWDDEFDATRAGWTYFLLNLVHALERHRGVPRTMTSVRIPVEARAEALWERLTGDAGLALDPPVEALAPGVPARLAVAGVPLRGETRFVRAPRNLAATLVELNDGLIFVELEGRRGRWHVGVWISTYGVAPERLEPLARGVRPWIERVLAGFLAPDRT